MATPEHSPRHFTSKDLSSRWDMDAISHVLSAPAQEAQDLALGVGMRFTLGEGAGKTLEIYPISGVVRLTTSVAQIALFGATEAKLSPEGLVIERGDVKLGITPDGGVAFSTILEERQDTPGELANMELPAEQHTDEHSKGLRSEEMQERLALLGRVGAIPSFRTTPKGTLVARFPLAIHQENNKTTWHTVLAFGERAEKLKDSLTKGQQAEVIGYRHFREMRMRDGRTKTVEEVYAVVVKSR